MAAGLGAALKQKCQATDEGFFTLSDGVKVPVRLFLSQKLWQESEYSLYEQVKTATEYPGVIDVVITPDTHHGYVVPVGCVIATDGPLLQAACGYDIGCLTADTLIPLADGCSYPIGDLTSSDKELHVFSMSADRKVVVARALARRTRSQAPLVRVTLDHGRTITCTPDHEFMLRDGAYRPAAELAPGASLMPFNSREDHDGHRVIHQPESGAWYRVHWMASHSGLQGAHPSGEQGRSGVGPQDHGCLQHGYNHKVSSVEWLTEREDVFCLSVPDHGNFALEAGIFVHNCGMMSFRSRVPMGRGYDDRLRRRFSEEVMKRVGIGVGQRGNFSFTRQKFQEIIRAGATALGYERGNSERDFIPVDDHWDPPAKAVDRGIGQLGSLGGGNHFIELQHDQEGCLWVMVHTGSRGFGHQLATHFIQTGKEDLKQKGIDLRGGAEAVYFEPDSPLYFGYRNAVAAGGNFAIANRLLLWEGVSAAFRQVFEQEPELVYEISHNLVQEEVLADGRRAWIHRKGATRAFPAGHPMLEGTRWEKTGHPVLIPGSMGDQSYILMPREGAARSLFSVNHGCGRRMSRSKAKKDLSQSGVNQQMKRLNVMVNAGRDVPIDESPDVYKPAKDVIQAVVDAGLAEVTVMLTPIASIKGED